MKVFTRDYRIDKICSPIWGEYYNGLKPCVLDIETTGLDPRISKVIMIAFLTETTSGVKITQFLAENHYEENKVLAAALEFLDEEKIGYTITYNGKTFDIPFINKRLNELHFDKTVNLYDFDLYNFLKNYSILPDKLTSLRQKCVEEYFGISSDRKDTISGKESVALFNKYSIDGNSTIEKIILTHNREDVLQLYKVLNFCTSNDFASLLKHEDFHKTIAKYGFPVCNGKYTVRPKINRNQMIIRGDQNFDYFSAAYFPDGNNIITATFSASTKSFEIFFPIDNKNENFYIDLKKLGLEINQDPDVVNDFLILNPRTINLLSKLLLKKY